MQNLVHKIATSILNLQETTQYAARENHFLENYDIILPLSMDYFTRDLSESFSSTASLVLAAVQSVPRPVESNLEHVR